MVDMKGKFYTKEQLEYIKAYEGNNRQLVNDFNTIFSDNRTLSGMRYIRSSLNNKNITEMIRACKLDDARVKENRMKHMGESGVSVAGQSMVIIKWDKASDIDVQFEDGTVVHTSYKYFKQGCVNNPNFTYRDRDKIERRNALIGRENIMTCGLKASIINVIDTEFIIIRFEDGCEVKVRYQAFKKGYCKHPNISNSVLFCNKNERIGYKFTTVQGLIGEVIDYQDTQHVTVLLSTGYKREKVRWKDIKCGKVLDPNYKPEVGKIYNTVYGISAEVIEYNDSHNVKIKFEDGACVTTSIYTVRRGVAIHPDLLIRKRKKFSYNNFTCEYIYSTDVDKYYVCKCSKCGYDQILSAKEMQVEHHCVGVDV